MRSDILNANSQQSGGYKLKATNLVSDTTLTEADSGKVFFITAAATVAITLPTATSGEDGIHFKFVVWEETPTAAITIGAGSAIVSLVMKDAGGDASNSTAGTQVSNIVIGTSAQRGDYVNMTFFGGEWVADCMSSINNAVTTS
tara:strand:- start:251 stop:682 length:432 start_codon:yes stop_codon:yes gene_type:complete